MGLVNICVRDDQLDAEILKLCVTIQQNSSFKPSGHQAIAVRHDGMSLAAGLAYEIYRTPGVGPDMRERIDAFMNRKKR